MNSGSCIFRDYRVYCHYENNIKKGMSTIYLDFILFRERTCTKIVRKFFGKFFFKRESIQFFKCFFVEIKIIDSNQMSDYTESLSKLNNFLKILKHFNIVF